MVDVANELVHLCCTSISMNIAQRSKGHGLKVLWNLPTKSRDSVLWPSAVGIPMACAMEVHLSGPTS